MAPSLVRRRWRLRLRVRDDGKGIDTKVLAEGGRDGHYGLAGMRERAKLAGGKLAVRSKLDSGTEADHYLWLIHLNEMSSARQEE